ATPAAAGAAWRMVAWQGRDGEEPSAPPPPPVAHQTAQISNPIPRRTFAWGEAGACPSAALAQPRARQIAGTYRPKPGRRHVVADVVSENPQRTSARGF